MPSRLIRDGNRLLAEDMVTIDIDPLKGSARQEPRRFDQPGHRTLEAGDRSVQGDDRGWPHQDPKRLTQRPA